ncbi:hypothetical protein OPV22_015045 [Ensete ventricosum]|uniref:Uncharacterized protein n=1 Tax=Ensete ventricosum TaxID=4639 RepID=A0AAV8PRP4_ENSVE|nr:hypothetical protein OPV22_015045 [Ensete ventricosum]
MEESPVELNRKERQRCEVALFTPFLRGKGVSFLLPNGGEPEVMVGRIQESRGSVLKLFCVQMHIILSLLRFSRVQMCVSSLSIFGWD